MNKRGLIKYIAICTSVFFSFYFLSTSNIGFGSIFDLSTIFSLLFALTIFMYFNKNKIKKGKFVYDVILLLLMIVFSACSLYVLYVSMTCYFNSSCSVNIDSDLMMIYSILLFIMLLFGFVDIFRQTNKTNDILTIIVASLIILIHIRYYLDSNFINKIVEGDLYKQYTYYYITQNYIYFIIMYLVVIIHKRVNKV